MAKQAAKAASENRGAEVVGFNYDAVEPAHREALQEDAKQIRRRLVETAGAMMDIGERLDRSRKLLPHGAWLPWLVSETGMSEQWSRDCLNLYSRFAAQPNLIEELDVALSPTAIVRLAKAPEAAYDDILGRVRAGEKLRVADVEETVRKHRQIEREAKDLISAGDTSADDDTKPGADALRTMADRARDELVPLVIGRMLKLLDVLEDAGERIHAGNRVTVKELQELRGDAQWLSDALEQLTQRRAHSETKLVHVTFLDRAEHDPGPWAEAAAFLRDISSSDGCAATIKDAGVPAFVERGVTVLRDALQNRSLPALPRNLERIEQALQMDWIYCLECGMKVQGLEEHLATIGMTPEQYRKRWGLPASYPMTAPNVVLKKGRMFEFDPDTGKTHEVKVEAVSELGPRRVTECRKRS